MKKKIVSLLLSVLLLCTCAAAYAAGPQAEEPATDTCFSEYEYWLSLQTDTCVLSEEDAQFAEFDYYGALLERAQESPERLSALGYTEEQISELKAYAAEPEGEHDFYLMSSSSIITAPVIGTASSTRDRKATVGWSWDSMPLMAYNDRFAIRWIGVNAAGGYIDLTCDPGRYSGTVTYYDTVTGYPVTSDSLSFSADASFSSLTCSFPVTKYSMGMDVWAKTGSITYTLSPRGH